MDNFNLFLCFIILNFLAYNAIASNSLGFSTNFIHRSSPLSAHYNSSNTYFDNLRESVQRARARASHILSSSPPSVQTPLSALPGEYLMKVSVGTPPLDFELVADTGSDLIWTQCQPCTSCYNQTDAIFNPQKSSTYQKQSCDSTLCQSLQDQASCTSDDGNSCQYTVQYGDRSTSSGDLSIESFTFQSTSGSPVVLPNISFGCGYNNDGNFNADTDGIVGLGGGEVSLVNQLSNKYFSYCLVPLSTNVTSTISFGTTAVVSGPGVQTTPYYTQAEQTTFYNLNLQSVSANGKNFKFNSNRFSDKAGVDQGNIIIDSGTTLTFLDTQSISEIENAFKQSVSAKPIEGPGGGFQLCYNKGELNIDEVPTITFHFEGADVDLGALNTLTEVEQGVVCLSILPSSGDGPGLAIFGNLQQMDFLIGYDLEKKTVSFKKVDCSKQ